MTVSFFQTSLQHWVTLFCLPIFQTIIKIMAAKFVVTGSKKRRVEEPEFPANRCVLCGAPFSAKNPASTPDLTKIQSLFAACSELQDEVGLRLLAKQSSILDGSVTIRYHRHCQSTYTSKLHLKRSTDKQVKPKAQAVNITIWPGPAFPLTLLTGRKTVFSVEHNVIPRSALLGQRCSQPLGRS